MKAHYFQHVPFEGLGSIAPWLTERGIEISCSRLFANDPLPQPETIDFLVVMGGPMSVNDEQTYPWLVPEKAFIRQFIASGKPLLGICLGAQLIAAASGSSVYPNPDKEIGWLEVEGLDNALFDNVQKVFQWHGDTFDLPPGARQLARSRACENQAFAIGGRVIGLQFHLETTAESALALVEHGRDELQDGRYIQSADMMLSAPPERYRALNNRMDTILSYLLKLENTKS